jgi:hypothetical protein
MIEITQREINISPVVKYLTDRSGRFSVKLNRELLERDRDRFKESIDGTKNKISKKNLKAIVAYYDKLIRELDVNSLLKVHWVKSKSNLVELKPVEFVDVEAYGVRISNYIELSCNQKMVSVDIEDLADILSFEFMYRDLGESHRSVEKLLKDCNIISIDSADKLIKFFEKNGDKLYESARHMKIVDTPYRLMDSEEISDYFKTREFRSKTYNEVIEYSCKYAALAVMGSILHRFDARRIKPKVVTINQKKIQLIIECEECSSVELERTIPDIVIRTFGRKFKLSRKVEII